ncbi:tRNA glutamyl-Q(34) synthetase GluQRS [Sphingosinicella sp. BN140058]|uniref:tRNA glutamyl-Q(34) synthetase GluQRS n=1 Tax=Sphingosinicella sp. BN140058 TaxID=1892855 RepID=UPI0010136B6B|nr:tRNA glutamyl-Q(34) synthetase GluQRS [Sphingosinicella sp. BN140058]QAY77212.1 tRNA glutamyl-Q(34) synthetase GluQRS [Sphingosinicella sp. BN140058]
MQIVSRFAPSPTGRLHLGHAYSALLAHDHARERSGAFLLRIEDIDPGRARAVFVDGIIEDLIWLGLEWDGEILFQSERLPIYAEALDRLKDRGLAYPCFCTRSEIAAEVAASASAPHGPDGPLYPGTCRRLDAGERARRIAAEPHAWRLDTARAIAATGPLYWHDGDTEVLAEPQAFGDVVLARKDAPTSYHLAVTVDDAAQGVTDVVRGRDLYAATDVHRLLQALLDLQTPLYHHHALLTGSDGRRLAKRNGAPTLASLRESGTDPAALIADLRMGQLPGGYSTAGA